MITCFDNSKFITVKMLIVQLFSYTLIYYMLMKIAKYRFLLILPRLQGFRVHPVSYTHLDVYKRQILNIFI